MNDKLEIVTRAIDWLEANPQNHVVASLARDKPGKGGMDVAPTDPRAACFCILGRIAKEAGIEQEDEYSPGELDEAPYDLLDKWLAPFRLEVSEVYDVNDTMVKRPQAEVIADLRNLFHVEKNDA